MEVLQANVHDIARRLGGVRHRHNGVQRRPPTRGLGRDSHAPASASWGGRSAPTGHFVL